MMYVFGRYLVLSTAIINWCIILQLTNYLRKTNKRTNERAELYTAPGGAELPKHVLEELTQFTKKRNKAVIDVYWLYDDGGLSLLLPYIISTRRNWGSVKLRYIFHRIM